ncbi:MAG: MBL fold metallo-hydrolase [Myxococcota bacterium]
MLFAIAAALAGTGARTTTLETGAGTVTFFAAGHGTVRVDAPGTTVWIDPWSETDLSGPKADLVLVTDVHFDHLDAAAAAQVAGPKAVFVAPKSVADQLERKVDHVLANGEKAEVAGIGIEAVPMYNLVRGPEEGKRFHDKGRGNGYILTIGGKRVYFAGDTECTDEMKALKGIDLAFVPMNLPYTMPPDEAAACVAAFAPAVAVPYHYRGSDLSVFTAALKGTSVKVQELEFYAGGEK